MIKDEELIQFIHPMVFGDHLSLYTFLIFSFQQNKDANTVSQYFNTIQISYLLLLLCVMEYFRLIIDRYPSCSKLANSIKQVEEQKWLKRSKFQQFSEV